MKNITVIGAGTMGNGIAHVFAQNNFSVILADNNPAQLESALKTITKNFDRQQAKGIIDEDQKKRSLANIKTSTNVTDALANAALMIEAATENPDLKMSIFKMADEAAPVDCILATNTSSISITKIAAATNRPGKVIGMHFMNPVPVMKLVEIINGYHTENEVTRQIVDLSKTLGKTPCVVSDYPGFIANRILMPMINEAIYTLYEKVAGVEEIDTIMKLGMAHPMGPLQLADFIGLDVCLAILRVLYDGLGNQKYAPCPLLIKMVTASALGVKTSEGFYKYDDSKKISGVSRNFS